MKTHLKTFLLAVGFFAAVTLIVFAVYSWRLAGAALLISIAFAFVYGILYFAICENKLINDIEAMLKEEEKNKKSRYQQKIMCEISTHGRRLYISSSIKNILSQIIHKKSVIFAP